MPRLQRSNIRTLKRRGGVPGRLALKALRYAAALPPLEPAIFADRLYRYHTLPRSSLGNEHADLARLAVLGDWRINTPDAWPWVHLTRGTRSDARWKLYLSPRPDQLVECVRLALPILSGHGARSVKIGRNPEALLRPDRCLVYFDRHESLIGASNALQAALRDFMGLGVPFTAPVGTGHLLSWAVDPLPTGKRQLSWRQWVTMELGAALYQCSTSPETSGDAVEFALLRLEANGVDLARFTVPPGNDQAFAVSDGST